MFEYMQLIRPGDNLLSVDFITRVALLIFSGLILVAIGYKINESKQKLTLSVRSNPDFYLFRINKFCNLPKFFTFFFRKLYSCRYIPKRMEATYKK